MTVGRAENTGGKRPGGNTWCCKQEQGIHSGCMVCQDTSACWGHASKARAAGLAFRWYPSTFCLSLVFAVCVRTRSADSSHSRSRLLQALVGIPVPSPKITTCYSDEAASGGWKRILGALCCGLPLCSPSLSSSPLISRNLHLIQCYC